MRPPIFVRYGAYLMLLKLMNKFGKPFEDRMSMVEFESYEKKVYKSNGYKGGEVYRHNL